MKETLLPILGVIGNVLLLGAYVPQISKMLRTKKAEDVSIATWILWFLGDGCFLIYSALEKDWYSTVLFAALTIGNVLLIILTHRYGKITTTL